jgi:hypothetical protein
MDAKYTEEKVGALAGRELLGFAIEGILLDQGDEYAQALQVHTKRTTEEIMMLMRPHIAQCFQDLARSIKDISFLKLMQKEERILVQYICRKSNIVTGNAYTCIDLEPEFRQFYNDLVWAVQCKRSQSKNNDWLQDFIQSHRESNQSSMRNNHKSQIRERDFLALANSTEFKEILDGSDIYKEFIDAEETEPAEFLKRKLEQRNEKIRRIKEKKEELRSKATVAANRGAWNFIVDSRSCVWTNIILANMNKLIEDFLDDVVKKDLDPSARQFQDFLAFRLPRWHQKINGFDSDGTQNFQATSAKGGPSTTLWQTTERATIFDLVNYATAHETFVRVSEEKGKFILIIDPPKLAVESLTNPIRITSVRLEADEWFKDVAIVTVIGYDELTKKIDVIKECPYNLLGRITLPNKHIKILVR